MDRKMNVHDRLGWNPKSRKNVSQNHTRKGRTQDRNQKRKFPSRQNRKQPASKPRHPEHQSQSNPSNSKPESSCHCACQSRNAVVPTYNRNTGNINIMLATIPVFLCHRKIRAALSSGSSLTKIGEQVADIAISNGCVQKTKTFYNNGAQKTVKVVTAPIGTRMPRMRFVECVIDPTAPPMGIMLGLPAMKALGYKIVVDRTVAEHHGAGESQAQRDQSSRSQDQEEDDVPEEPFNKEDFIISISEAEMREIENY